MYRLVKSWQEGKQSKSDFCKDQPINIHTFTYWVQKYKIDSGEKKVKSKSEKFISLKVKNSEPLHHQGIELCYPNGIRLKITGQADIAYLESLLRIKV